MQENKSLGSVPGFGFKFKAFLITGGIDSVGGLVKIPTSAIASTSRLNSILHARFRVEFTSVIMQDIIMVLDLPYKFKENKEMKNRRHYQ